MVELTQQDKQIAFKDICLSSDDIETRDVTLADLRDCLSKGWADFSARPLGSAPLIVLFYFLGAFLITLAAFGLDLRYFAFPIVAGFTLVGPIVALGFFEISRQREQGLQTNWRSAFEFIHTSSFAPVLALSLTMAVLYLFWLYLAELIYFSLFSANPPASVGDFISQLFTTRHGGALIAYGNFVGFLFAFAALSISAVAFPLALDKPVTSLTAVSVSIRAVTSNMLPMIVWGLIVGALLLIGAAFFLIGLAVTLPVLGHATWHLYRKLVVQ